MIIFNLSPVLGSRSEVLKTPCIEVLGYIELNRERKKAERWNNFMDLFYATQQGIKKEDRQRFIETIKPVTVGRKGVKANPTTDLEMLKRMKDAQQNRTGG
jgi:hypothetical protein